MRARRIKREYDAGGNVLSRDLVFFGSYGLNSDGTAKFYNPLNKHDNFSEKEQAVADSLLVKLNILEGELWYAVTFGWPLWENHKNTYVLDMYVTSTINNHPFVTRIENFTSKVERVSQNRFLTYFVSMDVVTQFGTINFSINRSI